LFFQNKTQKIAFKIYYSSFSSTLTRKACNKILLKKLAQFFGLVPNFAGISYAVIPVFGITPGSGSLGNTFSYEATMRPRRPPYILSRDALSRSGSFQSFTTMLSRSSSDVSFTSTDSTEIFTTLSRRATLRLPTAVSFSSEDFSFLPKALTRSTSTIPPASFSNTSISLNSTYTSLIAASLSEINSFLISNRSGLLVKRSSIEPLQSSISAAHSTVYCITDIQTYVCIIDNMEVEFQLITVNDEVYYSLSGLFLKYKDRSNIEKQLVEHIKEKHGVNKNYMILLFDKEREQKVSYDHSSIHCLRDAFDIDKN
jgi:hypothetical protein